MNSSSIIVHKNSTSYLGTREMMGLKELVKSEMFWCFCKDSFWVRSTFLLVYLNY